MNYSITYTFVAKFPLANIHGRTFVVIGLSKNGLVWSEHGCANYLTDTLTERGTMAVGL